MSEPGAIFVIGGHEDRRGRRVILREIAARLGGRGVAILAAASRRPGRYVAMYRRAFGGIGVPEIVEIPVPDRTAASSPRTLGLLDRVGCVLLTGGKQRRLLERVAGTPLHDGLRDAWRDGLLLAGTSAGASALAERAIGPRGTDPGLGLVTRSIIDQHFSERDRAGRLIRAVLADGRRTGYGIDEDTALVLEGGTSHVLGSGTVTVIEPGGRLRRHGTGETVAAAHTRS